MDQETIFIRNCVQGFVCIGEPKTTSSEDIFACVNENYLTNHKSKFVGFGCDGASNMMGCKTGLVTRLQECYPEVEEIESEREIQSNRKGEIDSEENMDEGDVDSNGENDSESECEQSEDETFRNVNKFVEIEYEMEYILYNKT